MSAHSVTSAAACACCGDGCGDCALPDELCATLDAPCFGPPQQVVLTRQFFTGLPGSPGADGYAWVSPALTPRPDLDGVPGICEDAAVFLRASCDGGILTITAGLTYLDPVARASLTSGYLASGLLADNPAGQQEYPDPLPQPCEDVATFDYTFKVVDAVQGFYGPNVNACWKPAEADADPCREEPATLRIRAESPCDPLPTYTCVKCNDGYAECIDPGLTTAAAVCAAHEGVLSESADACDPDGDGSDCAPSGVCVYCADGLHGGSTVGGDPPPATVCYGYGGVASLVPSGGSGGCPGAAAPTYWCRDCVDGGGASQDMHTVFSAAEDGGGMPATFPPCPEGLIQAITGPFATYPEAASACPPYDWFCATCTGNELCAIDDVVPPDQKWLIRVPKGATPNFPGPAGPDEVRTVIQGSGELSCCDSDDALSVTGPYPDAITAQNACLGSEPLMMAAPAPAPTRPRPAAPAPGDGLPGSHLAAMIRDSGLGGVDGCGGCMDMVAWMDRIGPDGCRLVLPREMVLARLRDRAAKVGWGKKIAAGLKLAAAGLILNPLDPAEGLLREALRRAEPPPA